MPLETDATLPLYPLALSQVYNDYTIGTAGSTALENVKEAVFLMYPAAPGSAEPFKAGIVNTESLSVSGSATQQGYIKN